MGYFGHSGFDNDDALDWLGGIGGGVTGAISRALNDYLRYARSPPAPEHLSKAEIAEIIEAVVRFNKENPPGWWRRSGKPKAQHLEEIEQELREKYSSGRYLNEEYGPVEIALAAAELTATLAGQPPADLSPTAAELVRRYSAERIQASLLKKAANVVEQVLRNRRYARMRKFYLEAFPDVSGGADSMRAVKDLLNRLRAASALSEGAEEKRKRKEDMG